MTYHVARQEYHAALAAVQDMEDNLPGTAGTSLNTTIWRGQPEIEEQTRLRLHTAGEALRNAEDEKACEEYGPYRGAWLQVLADINEMGDHIRVYPVCRARLRGDGNDCGTPICGLSFPSSLWTRSKDGHEFVCKINWENFEKKCWRYNTMIQCMHGPARCAADMGLPTNGHKSAAGQDSTQHGQRVRMW